MTRILIATKVEERHKELFLAAAPGCSLIFEQKPTDEQLSEAEVIVGNIHPDRLKNLPALRLVQLQSAGVGAHHCLSKEGSGIRLCTASGSYGLAIAEHMFGMLLGLQKRLFAYRDRQVSGEWGSLGSVRSVYGSNVLVIGMGDIGGEFARRCKAFGANVRGIRRSAGASPDYCDAVGTQSDVDAWLPEADVVFMCMPETQRTIGFMNRERIAKMKPGAILLNAGRGSAIDTDALVDALNSGSLFGAGLDVTDPEPLPPHHPLWKCANVFITPHVSGGFHLAQTHDRVVEIACTNIRAWLEGGELMNEVDYERGY